MSTEVYGSRFRNGKLFGIAFAALHEAFAGLIVKEDAGEFVLKLDGTGGVLTSLSFRRTGDEATSFSVSRPVDDACLYEALLRLLEHEGVVVYAPGSPPVFGNPASEKHLPEDMSSALGVGVVVQTASELKNALFCG